MEERVDMEPGVLQNGIKSQNTPVGDGNTQRWKQLRGEIQKGRMRSKAPNTPCIFGRNQSNQGGPRPTRGKWSPELPVAPRVGHWAKRD